MGKLERTEIEARLAALARGWRLAENGAAIERDFELEDFAAAIALVNEIARRAEAADHHPDLLVHGYRHLRVTLSTHSQGGVSDADVALAAQIDALA